MTPSSSGTVVDAVRRSVNAQRFLGIATDLVGISSPTRCAAAVADKLAEMLTAFGFDVERHVADWPEAPAVAVRWEAARPGPVLQIDGRLDTVQLPFVMAFQLAQQAIAGETLPLGDKPFVDDGNQFASFGIPAITHGPAATGAHTVHESVALSELVRVAQVYAVTAIAFCNETS